VDRLVYLKGQVRSVIRDHLPDKVGIESPTYGAVRSETMVALFTHALEGIKTEQMDVVFFAPDQIKAEARLFLGRPDGSGDDPKWEMLKGDMIEAAREDAGGGRWSGDEADAYWVARCAGRFWKFIDGSLFPFDQKIREADLTSVERHQFLKTHTYVRGKKAGKTERKGLIYREGDRFFRWSKES